MRITDAMLAFPLIAAIVLFQQLLLLSYKASGALIFFGQIYTQGSPPTSLQIFLTWIDPVMLAFILFSWMPYARVMNAVVLLNKDREFIQAAKALGAGHFRVLIHHLIPNSISPSVVLAAKDVGGMVLLQATFTFIGMGGKSDWGNLLVIGRRWIIGPGGNPLTYWWVFIPATLALVLFGIGWNLLGDGFNDWLNPRTSQSG
jgi:peptide/nickel transport system permease protein